MSLKSKKIMYVLLILVIIIASATIAYIFLSRSPASTPNTAGSRVLIQGWISVNPGIYFIQFIVPNDAFNIHVSGNFSVDNGVVRVLIANESTFNKSGFSENIISNYDSGQSTNGYFNSILSRGGLYYLMYENKEQTAATIVDTQVKLSYYQK
jgi:hypothetical protein